MFFYTGWSTSEIISLLINLSFWLGFVAYSMDLSSFKCIWYRFRKKASFVQKCVSAVNGHPRSLILVPIESAYATSY